MTLIDVVLISFDFIILLLVLSFYYYGWFILHDKGEVGYDFASFVESTKVGLTAASILLPGAFIAARGLGAYETVVIEVTLWHIYLGAMWFAVSILCGVANLFRFPTLIYKENPESDSRIYLDDRSIVLIGVIQLSTIFLGSTRVILAFVL